MTLKDFTAALQHVHELYPDARPSTGRPGRLDFYFASDDLPCATLHLASGRLTIAKRENQYVATYPKGD